MKKKIVVFQATNERGFCESTLSSYLGDSHTDMSNMEEVVMLREEGEDDEILSSLFAKMNSKEYQYSLNYSLSVGDIVRINDTYYKCKPSGWENVTFEVLEDEWEAWESANEL